jgi:large subunit ribosomal protein L19
MNLVEFVNQLQMKERNLEFPDFRSGDTISVHTKVVEGDKSRVQIFQGICMAIKEKNRINGHFRVRKVASNGIGVEKLFPYYSPNVVKVELISKGKSRRAKHYYLRERTGKSAKVSVDYDRQ